MGDVLWPIGMPGGTRDSSKQSHDWKGRRDATGRRKLDAPITFTPRRGDPGLPGKAGLRAGRHFRGPRRAYEKPRRETLSGPGETGGRPRLILGAHRAPHGPPSRASRRPYETEIRRRRSRMMSPAARAAATDSRRSARDGQHTHWDPPIASRVLAPGTAISGPIDRRYLAAELPRIATEESLHPHSE